MVCQNCMTRALFMLIAASARLRCVVTVLPPSYTAVVSAGVNSQAQVRMQLTAECVAPNFVIPSPTVTPTGGNVLSVPVQGTRPMPVVGLGTWPPTYSQNITFSQYTALMMAWINLGGRHLDTAHIYKNEATVGAAVDCAIHKFGLTRSDFFITSKLPPTEGYQGGKTAINEITLPSLGHIPNLMLLHWPCVEGFNTCSGNAPLAGALDTWRALKGMLDAGKTEALGVSNFNVEQLTNFRNLVKEHMGTFPEISVNQIEWNLWHHDDLTLQFCHQLGIVVQAYSPLGGPSAPPLDSVPELASIAAAYNKTVFQIALKFVLQSGLVVLTSTENPDHMVQDLELFNFNLTSNEMATLSSHGSV